MKSVAWLDNTWRPRLRLQAGVGAILKATCGTGTVPAVLAATQLQACAADSVALHLGLSLRSHVEAATLLDKARRLSAPLGPSKHVLRNSQTSSSLLGLLLLLYLFCLVFLLHLSYRVHMQRRLNSASFRFQMSGRGEEMRYDV